MSHHIPPDPEQREFQRSSFNARAKRAILRPNLRKRVYLQREAFPVLRTNDMPIEDVLEEICMSEGFKAIEKELAERYNPESLRAAMEFAAAVIGGLGPEDIPIPEELSGEEAAKNLEKAIREGAKKSTQDEAPRDEEPDSGV